MLVGASHLTAEMGESVDDVIKVHEVKQLNDLGAATLLLLRMI